MPSAGLPLQSWKQQLHLPGQILPPCYVRLETEYACGCSGAFISIRSAVMVAQLPISCAQPVIAKKVHCLMYDVLNVTGGHTDFLVLITKKRITG